MKYRIELAGPADFIGWRDHARTACAAGLAPEDISWALPGAPGGLFGGKAGPLPRGERPVRVPRAFIGLARRAAAHTDQERFARLYRLLWRLQEDARLLGAAGDADIAWLMARDKAVRRDIHKMHAFVRFRAAGVSPNGRERFMAWFEPDHHILQLAAPFFQRRFPGMDWLILTPGGSAAWDGEHLIFGAGGRPEDVPAQDRLEEAWKTYFAAIFNPARLKVKAMTAEMPRKYWKNMPEAALIPQLIAGAEARGRAMQEEGMTEANPRTEKWLKPAGPVIASEGLDRLRAGLEACRACPLHAIATQPVPGEGPARAALMVVGEQPGDQEDLAGRAFVGPAGGELDAGFRAVGIRRGDVYLTNAVKHFKFERRGKARLHARPSAREIAACQPWLTAERQAVAPTVILALGATAARSLLGRPVRLADIRGQAIECEGATLVVTVHPAYLLRLPDPGLAARERAAFHADLARAARLAGIGPA